EHTGFRGVCAGLRELRSVMAEVGKPAALGRGQNRKVLTCKTIQQGQDFRDRMHWLGLSTLTKFAVVWLSKETKEIEERRATLRPIPSKGEGDQAAGAGSAGPA